MLWDEIKKKHGGLFWRSKISNPINSWYFKRAQGSWQTDKWIVFWYGIKDPNFSEVLVKFTNELPTSFVDERPSIKLYNF